MSDNKISFSYTIEDKLDPETGKLVGYISRPYVPVRLSINHNNPSNFINALVDSGSDRNLFPKKLGEMLGINFSKIKPVPINGIGNISIQAYPAKINIYVNNKKYETDADFCSEQQVLLLGRSGFFNLFKEMTFDEGASYLYIEP
jgi:hypothetical protein